ncbi:MAG TPA: hypothetical protein DHW82_05810 [Spirochaetia bacterium]|nr:hypothetical protein [Spirochaetia bacterium]
MKKSIIQKHDAAYKYLFDFPGMVKQLLENFVPMDWVKWIDYDKIEKVNASFVRKNYQKKESDVIYKLNFQNQTAYLYLLLELQSTVDPNMPFRIQSYVNDFYESLIKKSNQDRYPIVFPMVIYTGTRVWNVPENVRDKIEIPKDSKLEPYIPSLKYFKIIINEFKKESLLKIRNTLATIFLVEKLEEEEMEPYFKKIAKIIIDEIDPELKSAFTNWILRLADSKVLPDIQVLLNSSEEEVYTMLSATLEKMGKKRERIGEKRGEKKKAIETAKNMLKKGYDMKTIAELTGLTQETIQKLK